MLIISLRRGGELLAACWRNSSKYNPGRTGPRRMDALASARVSRATPGILSFLLITCRCACKLRAMSPLTKRVWVNTLHERDSSRKFL